MAFYVSEIIEGAPEAFANDTQRLIFESMDNAGIHYTRVVSDPGISMDDCLNLDKAFGVDTVKTILLTNRQKNKFWLYVTHARKPFITRDFSGALGIPRVSFADEELMTNVLGTLHGAATPLALLRDSAKDVAFVMDKEVAEREKLVLTSGDACSFVCLSNSDLFRLLHRTPILLD